jgi:transposase
MKDQLQNMQEGVLLSDHLSKHYGINLKVRQCQNLLHKSGFRLRKPRSVIAKGDDKLKIEFKKT